MKSEAESFSHYLIDGIAQGGFQTDDVLAGVLPLMRQVIETHSQGRVAPLIGISKLKVDQNHIYSDLYISRKNSCYFFTAIS